MNYPQDAKPFSTLMDVTWQSLGRNTVDKTTKQFWFSKLQKYDLNTVTNSFDKWLISSEQLPKIKDIVSGCVPKDDFYKALTHTPDVAMMQDGVKEIEHFIATNVEPKRDYKAWAHRALAEGSNKPLITINAAKIALGIKND